MCPAPASGRSADRLTKTEQNEREAADMPLLSNLNRISCGCASVAGISFQDISSMSNRHCGIVLNLAQTFVGCMENSALIHLDPKKGQLHEGEVFELEQTDRLASPSCETLYCS